MSKIGKYDVPDFFVLLGCIVGIILAILDIVGVGGWGWRFLGIGWIWNLIWGIIVIILCLGLLSAVGVLKLNFKIPTTGIALLIVGLVILIPTGNWGGLLIIIAAILVFVGN